MSSLFEIIAKPVQSLLRQLDVRFQLNVGRAVLIAKKRQPDLLSRSLILILALASAGIALLVAQEPNIQRILRDVTPF